MFRYLERCENSARLLRAGLRISITQSDYGSQDWDSVLTAASIKPIFDKNYSECNSANVTNFILRDKENPSSVLSSVKQARQNARMIRTVLTKEVFESVNEIYFNLKDLLRRPVTEPALPKTLDTIQRQSALVRGCLHGTMLRNDVYDFARLGTFIERGDNTARILDMKYHILLPAVSYVGSSVDISQWENILRSVSAYQSYRWLNENELNPLGICNYLILDSRLPRSLNFCSKNISNNLNSLSNFYIETFPSFEISLEFSRYLETMLIENVFKKGLHEFLLNFIAKFNSISAQIEKDLSFKYENFEEINHFERNNLKVVNNIYDVFNNTDCVVVMTEWNDFYDIDWNLASKNMRKPGWVFDTRNIIDHSKVKESGLNLWVVGKN